MYLAIAMLCILSGDEPVCDARFERNWVFETKAECDRGKPALIAREYQIGAVQTLKRIHGDKMFITFSCVQIPAAA